MSGPGSAASAEAGAVPLEALHTTDRLGHYLLGKTLGEGAFAKVKAATHIPTGHRVAIKFLYKNSIKEEYVWRNLHREAALMKQLRHPHIIQLFEVIETEHAYCLVTELAEGGEVLDYIVAHGRLHEKEARKFVRQMVSAVQHMHSAMVVHRFAEFAPLQCAHWHQGPQGRESAAGRPTQHQDHRFATDKCGGG